MASGAHKEVSPFATNKSFEPFDETPGIFDNNIFHRSLRNECVLEVDCLIARDPKLRPIVELFAKDQRFFFEKFSEAFTKLATVGHHNLAEGILIDVPIHKNLYAEGRHQGAL